MRFTTNSTPSSADGGTTAVGAAGAAGPAGVPEHAEGRSHAPAPLVQPPGGPMGWQLDALRMIVV
ncbi:hypothetical protein [Saccharothrix algeriensis]|uniref:Uncharacterized protein n=1 Tax=Saccharothrix algeriensis TaxID=173560 RepID=A0A8T8I145_9PSEU|nr:hypothetical protein [Saccharothrix algeriensis]MBM7810302.1 hypothetical protein [Saccharothrix algeriensis]QTR04456.1 hypothetical protein J7S33_06110 [Saccharothrix algeriensis]